jgi:hypothetical protein
LGAGEEGSSKLEVVDGAELALSMATVLLLLLRVFLLGGVDGKADDTQYQDEG